MVSPPEKTGDLLVIALFKVIAFFSCRLLATPTFRHCLSSVLSKFSHKKINFSRVSPSGWCPRGGPHHNPLVTPLGQFGAGIHLDRQSTTANRSRQNCHFEQFLSTQQNESSKTIKQ